MEDIGSSTFNDQLQKYREYHGLNDAGKMYGVSHNAAF